ncbi:MAG: hypothetical protein WEC81_01270 [Patescibacteria group bacterium]
MVSISDTLPVRWFRRRFLSDSEKQLVTLGLMGVVFALVCGWGVFATGIPWSGTADSRLHLDYAWQVGHGELPAFWDGTEAPLDGYKSEIQFVSHHPPLYYALLAPIVTPLLDAGHVSAAILAARVFSIFIGILCALALAWGGWLVGGKHRALFAVATPAIATALLAFNVTGDIMNDGLATLFSIAAMVGSILIIQKGLSAKYVWLLALVCLGGMASRSSFIGTLAVVFIAIFIAAFLHGQGRSWRQFFVASGICAVIVTVLIAGIGWFYYHNYQLSGSLFRNRPAGSAQQILHRRNKTLPFVLKSPGLWDMVTTKFYGKEWKILPKVGSHTVNYWLSIGVWLYISTGVFLRWRSSRSSISKTQLAIVGLLILQFMIVYGQQIAYAVGYGGFNRRYLLPAWLPFGLFLAAGALYWQKLRGLAVVTIAGLAWLAVYAQVINFLVTRSGIDSTKPWEVLKIGIVDINHLPDVLLPLLTVGLLAGLAIQGIVLWKLTTQVNR